MKAIVLKNPGGVENLITKDIETPVPAKTELLVKTKAISINPVDWKTRSMAPVIDMIYGPERPVILGWDIAGTVEDVGENVTGFKVGDRVFGMVNFPGAGKAYGEYATVPENQIATIPDGTSFEDAAATTLAALTALQAMKGKIDAGDKVLIHAGSGGVGHYAIQLAKNMGAHVVTTCSSKNKAFVISLGVDEHIDYRTQAFEKVISEVDFVLDCMGGEVLMKSLDVLKAGGTVVSLLSQNFDAVVTEAGKRNVTAQSILVQSSGRDMNELKQLLASGKLKAHVSKKFSFEQMKEAHAEIETGRTVGKIVVTLPS